METKTTPPDPPLPSLLLLQIRQDPAWAERTIIQARSLLREAVAATFWMPDEWKARAAEVDGGEHG